MYLIKYFLFFVIVGASYTYSQNLPYLFTFTTQNYMNKSFLVNYEAAYGQKTFQPIGVDDFEQDLGLRVNLGKYFTFFNHTGLAFTNGITRLTMQTELTANLLNTKEKDFLDFSAGLGYLHEYFGTNVLISRFIVGKNFQSWQIYSNLLFEHPFSPDRDKIDLTTSVGFSYKLTKSFSLGIEVVGQDIEGFWEADEAEGGAILYAGPSINFIIPSTTLNITFGGGVIFRATRSLNISEADRALPFVKENGFIIRNIVSLAL